MGRSVTTFVTTITCNSGRSPSNSRTLFQNKQEKLSANILVRRDKRVIINIILARVRQTKSKQGYSGKINSVCISILLIFYIHISTLLLVFTTSNTSFPPPKKYLFVNTGWWNGYWCSIYKSFWAVFNVSRNSERRESLENTPKHKRSTKKET